MPRRRGADSEDPVERRMALAVEEFERAAAAQPGQIWANTTWLGVHALKGPWDLWVAQEIIAETRPDVIVETGVAQGGSALFYATVMDALGHGAVVGVDVGLDWVHEDVRRHKRITLLEGSSTDPAVLERVRKAIRRKRSVMVILDSDHSAGHVSGELRALAPLVTPGQYLVVEDTAIGRPLGEELLPGPAEALEAWLAEGQPFEVDRSREKFLLTGSPDGYLRRV